MDFPGRKPLPALDDLPLRKGDPPFSAWGLWENAQLGSLSYLSDDVVKAAAREEIQTGGRVGLKYALGYYQVIIANYEASQSTSSIPPCWEGSHFRSISTTRHHG
jgi:hypothetical protein